MSMRRWPRTDIGTVVLHWLVVGAIGVLTWTGLRFAADDVHSEWLRDFDRQLASEDLWVWHIYGGYVLTFAVAAYAVYMIRARLGARIRLDAARLQGLFGTAKQRWSCINVLLCWGLFASVAGVCVTGWLAYHDAGAPVLLVHRWCTWAILGFPLLHVFALIRMGGATQIVRIFRPKRTEVPEEDIDLADLVADLLAQKQDKTRTLDRTH
ncbi:cytochrome b/b6 domain-containing protein [Maritimibacter sp. DP1N21-5]|uniref:cytochrome b/b6 domain-containing protein n=1 Tax=Maritimibacter sp. DP1N21-5 TaxID=2836867 RepID=UPI001C48C7E2|nr:cytochrome b/b6 domain-containing protein [Maritimibacter sp. DP1N21-5]MBV7407797.1 cytochrome b/b6 domain-containing protein [Maritimibacter sp. DP1N21-5]